jgi:hypothetical protein
MRLLANALAPGARKPNKPRSALFVIQFLPREITKSHFTSNSLTRLKNNSASFPEVKPIRASLPRFFAGAVSTTSPVSAWQGPLFISVLTAQGRETQ